MLNCQFHFVQRVKSKIRITHTYLFQHQELKIQEGVWYLEILKENIHQLTLIMIVKVVLVQFSARIKDSSIT